MSMMYRTVKYIVYLRIFFLCNFSEGIFSVEKIFFLIIEKAAICYQDGIKIGKVNNSFSTSTCYNRKTAPYQPEIVLLLDYMFGLYKLEEIYKVRQNAYIVSI